MVEFVWLINSKGVRPRLPCLKKKEYEIQSTNRNTSPSQERPYEVVLVHVVIDGVFLFHTLVNCQGN